MDHFRDEIDRSRYALEAWRTRPVYASPEHILAVGKALVEARKQADDAWWGSFPARFEASLNTKPDDNSAAEAAVGYSLD